MPSFQFNFNLGAMGRPRPLGRVSMAILVLYGLSLLLIHLGDTRVLTRHEVLAAQPAREMLHSGSFQRWMLPMLAGLPREAKPPGMMWLIAASMYVFRSESEWVARLPSALAGFAVAVMIARLAARWFGDRMGRLAGLVQLSSVYMLMQAKLSETDMCLVAAVCTALCSLAIGVIDSPFGLDESRGNRAAFWLAMGAAFLLKGPIGPLFIGLATVAFFFVSRRDIGGRRDWRIVKFIAEPVGIICCVIMVTGWPLAAVRLDPNIVHVWNSEAVGSATGKFGSDPFYYYFWSVPVMLLPWLPMTVIGVRRGPNAELAGSVNEQANRAMLWKFLWCWFVPGILFLTIGMKMKHHHYSMPVLPPLTIMTALGMDYYVRRQTSRRQGLVWPVFLGGCVAAAVIVKELHAIPEGMKPPIIALIAILAVGGLASLQFERLRSPGGVLASYFLTAWSIGLGVQAWAMPPQDDFKFQADFARAVGGAVPPGDKIYMLGDREEEQEAEYAYYLRFPMQRLLTAEEFIGAVKNAGGEPTFAIVPVDYLAKIEGAGQIKMLMECGGLRQGEREGDRLCLVRGVAN